ncbi:prolyl oligopeptidase family serine peptidase [Brachybacterium paraconglomeratum]|uniref:prolyl oligopeptidase family serine peptidase n=1 Tax=Brachybacterium paraconglomeratum TaxID=173362 RepID=UPI0022AE7E50|nr:prolyl oligopeptidase family serine peptidase [Brachybacterium paraconglomeratum]MCZ4326425.1 prolyl oligopeptidase family serine peptidase [Brachybacterium paraconglomeratum]
MVTTLPYGSWPSPLTADLLATGGTRLGSPRLVGREVWWTEGIATEGGRQAIVRTAGPVALPPAEGAERAAALSVPADRVTVLPAPFNARSRVHEYGGASWTVVPAPGPDGQPPLVVFVNFADQRAYALREGERPRALTPVGPEVESAHGPSLRWADPTVITLADGSTEVWWVCEDHAGLVGRTAGADGSSPDGGAPRPDADDAPHVERSIVAVPLDGSAAEDPAALRRITPASRFVAHPRLSPDGTHLAWISWEHPQMPWDGTELHVAPLLDGSAGEGEIIAGGTDVSALQPEWLDDERLLYLSDVTGWWNPWTWSSADGARQVLEREEEFAGPMWALGTTWYQVLDADRALVQHGRAATSLSVLRISTGELAPLDCPLTEVGGMQRREDGLLVLAGASPTAFGAIHLAELRLEEEIAQADPSADPSDAAPAAASTGGAPAAGRAPSAAPSLSPLTLLRSSRDDAPDPGLLPEAESIEVPLADGGVVHAIVHRPRQEGLAGREGELPPFIAQVHGGPTAHVPPVLSLPVAYYTSRGLGVVVVNYGGSSGYGRAYRDRLKGQWGVVDVQDTVAVMEHLVAEGIADGERLAIEGGSAGGWTTLACLTRTDAFAAGISSFGVAELEQFRLDTHDFESRYIDGLVGPYPERRDLYVERAPLSHVDELEVPVLLLQGDEDRIVPPSQSEAFRDALAAKGIPHAYLLFEGEQHGFRKAETIVTAIESSLSFYGQVLGFSPACVPVLALERN